MDSNDGDDGDDGDDEDDDGDSDVRDQKLGWTSVNGFDFRKNLDKT